jgi:hypothetical protein
MELKENFKLKKNLLKYSCEFCNFTCYQKCDWDRHIIRPKHISNQAGNVEEIKKLEKTFSCICGRQFKTNSGLWKHQSKCNSLIKTEEIKTLSHDKNTSTLDKDELIISLLKQNSELLEIVKNGTMNNSNNTTHTNSHNKAFNLNFFLNETCKNAMNITDFVDSIKLQLTDLMEVGELGYVEGISKIIVKNLNNLDETVRPIHCTDKKRETMYIKDQDHWEKEDDNKTHLKKVINKVVDKNIRLLPQFREKYPEYNNAASKISDKYEKMVIEVMETDNDKKEKIISNISKSTIISNKGL